LTNQKVEAIGLGLNCRFGKSHWSIHTFIFFCEKSSPPDEKSNLLAKNQTTEPSDHASLHVEGKNPEAGFL
jgi:hypothetical protein